VWPRGDAPCKFGGMALHTSSLIALIVTVAASVAAHGQVAPVAKAPLATPMSADSLPSYVRTSIPTDAVILKIWDEGMMRSEAADLAQVLMDSVGSRLTASPDMDRAQGWLMATYAKWGVAARKEKYGTWNSWKRGAAFVQLTLPRSKALDATMLSWSGNTGGKWVDGDVVIPPALHSEAEFEAWLPSVKGKIVLADAPQYSCRSPQQIAEFGTPETIQSENASQAQLNATYGQLWARADSFYTRAKRAGAVAVFQSNFSEHPGIDKVQGAPANGVLPTIDIGCEDYGMLFRLALRNQGPHVRLMAESESLGERPVFNVIAEIKGATKPNEYVVLSAHFDSWEGHSGATDNGSGTITMLEAMRILKAVYPKPARTIVVGHWSGEEQGTIGSASFAEDHPEIVSGLQFAFNQDNGTGRIVSMGPSILPANAARLQSYLSAMPSSITQWIRMQQPGMYSLGSDHVSWLCRGAPALNLNALSWDYSYTTWHTNKDSYDKIVVDDLKNNATLTAMLAYMASEDPARSSRTLIDPLPINPMTRLPFAVGSCENPFRSTP
jgi:carboxypeptidase Q